MTVEGMVTYVCPVCKIEYEAMAECALVTCDQGHHLAIGSLPDESGHVQCEEIPDDEEE